MGKQQALVERVGADPRPAATPAREPAPLMIERARELQAIDRALKGAGDGRGELLLVSGPAGIGKTTLLDAARARAEAAGLVVLRARADEHERAFPYGVIRQLLEPTLRSSRGGRRARILDGAAAHAVPAVLGPDPGLPPEADAFLLIHGLYWLVANLSHESPLALLVDDLQWCDAPSLRFLTYLARRLDGLSATVTAALRSGEGGADDALLAGLRVGRDAHVGDLAPLSKAGVDQLLSRAFGRPAEPEFVDRCFTVTGGNPFYLHELAAVLIADGMEPVQATVEHVSGAAPQTIVQATLARLARAANGAVELAHSLAVLGADSDLPRAADLAGLDLQQAAEALDALVAVEVIEPGSSLVFRHPIVRNAV
ncbi:MAG TPA: AAA family ATPase [Candidatus Dormibacteraeota bacterium]